MNHVTTRLTRLIVLCIAMVIVLLSLSVCALAEEDSDSSYTLLNESGSSSSHQNQTGQNTALPYDVTLIIENSALREDNVTQGEGSELEETTATSSAETADIPGEGGSTENPDKAALEREALRAKILAERATLQDQQQGKAENELVLALIRQKLEKKKALQESQSVGISPENMLYPLDKISKSIQLAITPKGYERSIKAMEILDERLLEVKQSALNLDFSALRNAKDSYDAASLSLQLAMDEVEDEPLMELRKLLELEYQLEMHQLSLRLIELNTLRQIKEKLDEKSYKSYEGMFTILELDMKESFNRLNQRIQNTKIKIKLTQNMTETEIERFQAELESSIAAENEGNIHISFLIGLTEKQIEKVKTSIEQKKALEQETAAAEMSLEEAQELLKMAKIAYALNSTDIETVKVYTQEAKKRAAEARLE